MPISRRIYRRARKCLVLLALALSGRVVRGEPPASPLRMTSLVAPSFEELYSSAGREYSWRGSNGAAVLSQGGQITLYDLEGRSLKINFPGAKCSSAPAGELPLGQETSYYLGPQATWRKALHYSQVRYASIYAGVDLILTSNANRLEINFEVAPDGDAEAIRIQYNGGMVRLSGSGNLTVRARGMEVIQERPSAFEIGRNVRRNVSCRYVRVGSDQVRIRAGDYDHSSMLLIDPVLTFSTYLGGSGFDAIYATATDSSGNIYVAGETSSGGLWNNSLPPRSSRDAFVAKLNSSATAAIFTVYIGGSANDSAHALALDSSGNVYVAGITSSADFPVTSGSFSTSLPGTSSAFVVKFNSAGSLQYSTFLGSVVSGSNMGLAVDSSGAAYVAGQTASTSYPVTAGAFQTVYQGGLSDCFVSKLNASGKGLVYSTFIGGSLLDACAAIAIDSSGNAYVDGTTYSLNFPLQSPAFSGLGGAASAFVTKVNPTGSALTYSTYLGGTNMDQAYAIAVDAAGSAYAAGTTGSIDFPVTSGAFQTSIGGIYNAFVSKLSVSGAGLVYSTLLGGSNSDVATSISVDPQGRAVVGGYTSSSNFPTAAPIQAAFQGAFDAFASVLDPLGATLVFSSYFGGSGDDRGYGISSSAGTLLLAGMTSSANFPTATLAIQPFLNTAPDAFLLETSYISPVLSLSGTHSGNFFRGQSNAAYTLSVSNAPGTMYTVGTVTVTDTVPSGLTLVSMSGSGWTCAPDGSSCSRSDSLPSGAAFPPISVTVDVDPDATSPLVNQASVSGGGSVNESVLDSTIVVSPVVAEGAPVDLALNKSATQSSTLIPGQTKASNAVDGNTDGNFADGSISHTNYDANAWWQLDLGASATIGSMVIWNRTDCCGNRLSDYWVFVSDTPFLSTDTPNTLQNRAGTWSSHQTVQPNPSATVTIPGAQGRYVRVQLTGTNYLSLAEVQVLGFMNLALNKTATQSSTLIPGQTNASNAVDGNTDGNYTDGSVSHTNYDANAWWEVDVGEPAMINSITVWNRTDCCGSRMSDYWVFVSNTPFLATDTPATLQNRAGTWSSHQTAAPNPSASIAIAGAEGRYVRVQLTGANYLALAEVQVFGQ